MYSYSCAFCTTRSIQTSFGYAAKPIKLDQISAPTPGASFSTADSILILFLLILLFCLWITILSPSRLLPAACYIDEETSPTLDKVHASSAQDSSLQQRISDTLDRIELLIESVERRFLSGPTQTSFDEDHQQYWLTIPSSFFLCILFRLVLCVSSDARRFQGRILLHGGLPRYALCDPCKELAYMEDVMAVPPYTEHEDPGDVIIAIH
ncbi:hypothetical protein BCR37DRAFT_392800 [Protomyces lactucae-debilis]|uniref:Uncharacterized protein n=1 Tax=Protomyces lactucae-debilis TaxID=2754530 RepID=A0A1Y2FG54_PROLT|nr:uncharacterized protein BCR37DRAFT_392800 [Protomyces lactucae-debilis]ORY82597.1 hypothetical protein BCR37DRAFT_392800 [Protomyces lactucae-debilis]